ncbi:hypothetical protein [Actinokineospora xionganensis]|uniref:Uncharacterized protein n=1 Tax=Actinokineospora xionganensis TaxID=2684470 RepID=A0ABR7L328_9PSEU|nr:hypothetical protein [Actinokineospora xionganensis]MBC6447091.1 hypothetical protein [Actinokineospora xionganensis]
MGRRDEGHGHWGTPPNQGGWQQTPVRQPRSARSMLLWLVMVAVFVLFVLGLAALLPLAI